MATCLVALIISPCKPQNIETTINPTAKDQSDKTKMNITQTLKAIILLDAEGNRILGKYFDEETNTMQFERKIFVNTKSQKIRDEVIVVKNTLIIHKFVTDIHLYVVGNRAENPLILDSILRCLVDVITSLVSKNVERKTIQDHMSQIILALDEICDNGMILETDPNLVYQRVTSKDEVIEAQSMAQRLQSATGHIRFPWIRS